MRRLLVASALALVRKRLAQKPSSDAEVWKPADAGTASTVEAYYPTEKLERLRENTKRAAEHSAAYITAEMEKAKLRSERRKGESTSK